MCATYFFLFLLFISIIRHVSKKNSSLSMTSSPKFWVIRVTRICGRKAILRTRVLILLRWVVRIRLLRLLVRKRRLRHHHPRRRHVVRWSLLEISHDVLHTMGRTSMLMWSPWVGLRDISMIYDRLRLKLIILWRLVVCLSLRLVPRIRLGRKFSRHLWLVVHVWLRLIRRLLLKA